MDPWWTAQQVGPLSGICGAIGGLMGGFAGVLNTYLVPHARGRRTVVAVMTATATVGLALLAVGAAAEIAGQPFHVYQMPLLMGAVLYCSDVTPLPGILSRFRVAEAMQRAGLRPNVWGDRAPEVVTAALDKAWNVPGNLHRMCGGLVRAHLAVGATILVFGLALLWGSSGNSGVGPTVIGACMLACAGMLWISRRRHGPGMEDRRLAAEELRRSGPRRR